MDKDIYRIVSVRTAPKVLAEVRRYQEKAKCVPSTSTDFWAVEAQRATTKAEQLHMAKFTKESRIILADTNLMNPRTKI
jgi:hypothetical protein